MNWIKYTISVLGIYMGIHLIAWIKCESSLKTVKELFPYYYRLQAINFREILYFETPALVILCLGCLILNALKDAAIVDTCLMMSFVFWASSFAFDQSSLETHELYLWSKKNDSA